MSTKIDFKDGTLTVTRVFRAPREAVFEAWIETSKVQQWWGCAQTTAVRSEIEPKVGGKYVHHMTLEHAGEIPMIGRFTEYDPPSRLAYVTEIPPGAGPAEGAAMTVTVDFRDHPDGTEVRLVHSNIPEGIDVYVKGGWVAALEKLDGFVTATA